MTEHRLPRIVDVRTRLTLGLVLTTLVIAAAIAICAMMLTAGPSDADRGGPAVGAARVGDDVVVILSDDDAAAVNGTRPEVLRWILIVIGATAIPSAVAAWFVAGRLLGSVDDALTDVQAAEEDRRRRLQDAVHELRTPLAVMGTNLELALDGADLDSEASGFAEAARRALGRMDRTIDELAGTGAAVDDGDDPVDVSFVAADVIGEFSGPAHRRGLHLVATSSDALEVDSADRAMLRTVVGNLVANGVRLAPKGSVVSVDWGATEGWAWVAVIDEGPGIPERHHGRAFERGWRGSHERYRASDEGSGLGLTIARQLAEAQGGTVTIESGEGTGSTFTIWLPLMPGTEMSAVVAPDGLHPRTRPWQRDPVPA